MEKVGFVYFMSNAHANVLYVGVTNNLVRRVVEHKTRIKKGFTNKYNCDRLVYFERFDTVVDAIAREKQIKNWKRGWKDSLVKRNNPNWQDLSATIGVENELLERVEEWLGDYDE